MDSTETRGGPGMSRRTKSECFPEWRETRDTMECALEVLEDLEALDALDAVDAVDALDALDAVEGSLALRGEMTWMWRRI